MTGIAVFRSLAEAIRAGFMVESATPTGYVVRQQTTAGWARAVVQVKA